MSCVTTLDIEVKTTLSSLEGTEKVIVGSDAHLDLILEVQHALAGSAKATASLVDSIEKNFKYYTPENAVEFIAKVFPLFDLAKIIRKSIEQEGILDGVRSHLDEFEEEINDLFEIINDLSRYKTVDDAPTIYF